MTIAPNWIAADLTHRRLTAWAMEGDRQIIATETTTLDRPARTEADVIGALAALTAGWTHAPTIACGPIPGAPPLRPAPCTPLPDSLAGQDLAIVPGLSQTRPSPDLMQGEETRIAGFLRLSSDFDGVLVVLGEHTKWVRVSAGEVVSFQTVVTGELTRTLGGPDRVIPGEAFHDALSAAMSRPESLTSRIFTLRAAERLTGADDGPERLAGLLMGAELAATRPYWLGQDVALIGDAAQAETYEKALSAQGVRPSVTRGDTAVLAGIGLARATL